MHTAEIISIGDEITIGKILDTNSQWLSQKLTDLGVHVLYHTTVGDEIKPIVDVLETACNRADIVICTGGLGPTADDLTRQAVAELLKTPLVRDEAMLEKIVERFRSRGREMPESNAIQASRPEGSDFIPNLHGTAPGIAAVYRRTSREAFLFALPGVPAEMKQMWIEIVGENVRLRSGRNSVIKSRTILTFGMGESQVEAILPDLIRRDHYPRVGITANLATIALRVIAEETSEQECDAVIEPVVRTIYEHLGDLIYGEDDDTLEDVICRKLSRRSRKLATLEWGTRGHLAETISHAPGSQNCYCGGLVVRSNAVLERMLGFSTDFLDSLKNAPDELVAVVAGKVRERMAVDYALVIGPYPGPTQGDRLAFLALATPEGVELFSHSITWSPDLVDTLLTKHVLNYLRLSKFA